MECGAYNGRYTGLPGLQGQLKIRRGGDGAARTLAVGEHYAIAVGEQLPYVLVANRARLCHRGRATGHTRRNDHQQCQLRRCPTWNRPSIAKICATS